MDVITVRGEAELAARSAPLFADIRTEFVCAATDLNTWSQPGSRRVVAEHMRPSLAAGIVVRKLYTTGALTDCEQRNHLLEIMAMGAQVRVSPAAFPHETIIADRRAMVLAGAPVRGDREFTVTTSPTLIAGVYALLEAAWDAATDLRDHLRRDVPAIGPEGRAVLDALGAGLTDEVAARRLGLSLRTYRRRVAELLRLLDADSRFQAGLHAARHGLAR
ncbi:DNA-binding response regulator [Actinomadura craniellae]|uniref:DNA-binding response regulator n=1 Tax=Actinomadura craniellae TaxID=2231787 RepID=A0A365HAT0_9ACTN|nr:response regulator transcription factor [Actinomadura craniellae]RAY16036.1 DNA-binding response regulator [Actinomadura craniellae]